MEENNCEIDEFDDEDLFGNECNIDIDIGNIEPPLEKKSKVSTKKKNKKVFSLKPKRKMKLPRKGTKMHSGPVSAPVLDVMGEEDVVVGDDTFHISWAMTSDCDNHYGFQKIADARVTLNGKEVANYWVDYGPNSGMGSFFRGKTLIAEGDGSFSEFPKLVKMDVKGEDLEKECWCYTFHKPKSSKDKK